MNVLDMVPSSEASVSVTLDGEVIHVRTPDVLEKARTVPVMVIAME